MTCSHNNKTINTYTINDVKIALLYLTHIWDIVLPVRTMILQTVCHVTLSLLGHFGRTLDSWADNEKDFATCHT